MVHLVHYGTCWEGLFPFYPCLRPSQMGSIWAYLGLSEVYCIHARARVRDELEGIPFWTKSAPKSSPKLVLGKVNMPKSTQNGRSEDLFGVPTPFCPLFWQAACPYYRGTPYTYVYKGSQNGSLLDPLKYPLLGSGIKGYRTGTK